MLQDLFYMEFDKGTGRITVDLTDYQGNVRVIITGMNLYEIREQITAAIQKFDYDLITAMNDYDDYEESLCRYWIKFLWDVSRRIWSMIRGIY